MTCNTFESCKCCYDECVVKKKHRKYLFVPLFLQESVFFRLILHDSLDGLVFLLSDHGLMNKLEPMPMFYVSIQPRNIDRQGCMTSDPDHRRIFVYNI